MRKVNTFLLFVLLCTSTVMSQERQRFFLGIQPAITVEPFYEEGEFDFNILPAVFEIPLNQRFDVRLVPMINYHFSNTNNGISDIALYSVLPFIFKESNLENAIPYGIYLGPVLGFGRNVIDNHYTTTVAVEPGYLFETEKQFTIALGCQLGGSYFGYDSDPNKWVFHWGPKVSFGFWL